MKKLKPWNGQLPQSSIALKIDGIQAMLSFDGKEVHSRAGKPLYNIHPSLLEHGKKYEVFLGTFKETDSVLSTQKFGNAPRREVEPHEVYEIYPGTDPRLIVPMDEVLQLEDLMEIFEGYVAGGGEGLVIDKTYKMKKKDNWDVPITAVIPGKGKHLGRMGALMTPKGKVGTGFTDAEREETWTIGEIIEVEAMSLTEYGMFRHPRFVRRRWDKN